MTTNPMTTNPITTNPINDPMTTIVDQIRKAEEEELGWEHGLEEDWRVAVRESGLTEKDFLTLITEGK